MKKLIALLCLIALSALADTNYIAIVIREDIDTPDKAIGKIGMKGYFEDQTLLEWDALSRFVEVSTSNEWRVVCFAIDVGNVKKKDKNKKAMEDWIKGNLIQKDKVRVIACGLQPIDDIKAAGYEPIEDKL